MIILKIAAFWLPVAGIGGIAGAIETGTSPVNAIAVFLIGCVTMAAYARLDGTRYRRNKEIDRFISAKKHKERVLPPWKAAEPLPDQICSCALLWHRGKEKSNGQYKNQQT